MTAFLAMRKNSFVRVKCRIDKDGMEKKQRLVNDA